MSLRDDRAAIEDIITAIDKLETRLKGVSLEHFLADEDAQVWANWWLAVIGEAANAVSADFRQSHPHIPWSRMIGMRHRLVHGYRTVDARIVWATLQNDIPPLR
ncbi:MAG: DUF86 domain-containing protein, partial [Clostridiales bacterium]|nr:DUF86 domain-containing protein [Clostridiales bacterium]